MCMHTYIYLHVFLGETPDCVFTHVGDDGKKEISVWGHIFPVTEQSQPVTKHCCWLALPASVPGFSFTLHTKVILQFTSYFPRL